MNMSLELRVSCTRGVGVGEFVGRGVKEIDWSSLCESRR